MSPAKEILHSVQEKTCTQLHSVQCEGMENNPFDKAKAEYVSARAAYHAICRESEVSAAARFEKRPARFEANAKMIEAAENLIMSVQGRFRPQLEKLGLWSFYENLTVDSETRSLPTLIQIANETAKL